MNLLEEINILKKEYEGMQSNLKELGCVIDRKIIYYLSQSELNDSHIISVPKYRIKDVKSIINNIFYRRSSNKRTNRLAGIYDKVGTRIVLLTETDIKIASETLERQDDIWKIRVGRKLDKELENSFGYKAIHLYVTPLKELVGKYVSFFPFF